MNFSLTLVLLALKLCQRWRKKRRAASARQPFGDAQRDRRQSWLAVVQHRVRVGRTNLFFDSSAIQPLGTAGGNGIVGFEAAYPGDFSLEFFRHFDQTRRARVSFVRGGKAPGACGQRQ
jgi:hypothetical protein